MWNVARTDYGFCLGDGQIGIHSGDLAEVTTRGAFQWNQNHPLAAITDGAANTVAFGEIATPDRASFTAENKGALEKDARVQGRAIYELAYETELKGINVNKCRNLSVGGRYPGLKRNWSNLGMRNFDALAPYTGFNTINPPNSASCTPTSNPWGEGEGIYTASSYHFGGAHVVTFDGGVKFINDAISTTDTRIGMTAADYYAPGRKSINGKLEQTPNWTQESPFGVWGALGTRSGIEYAVGTAPID
jgi:hypothetical protein